MRLPKHAGARFVVLLLRCRRSEAVPPRFGRAHPGRYAVLRRPCSLSRLPIVIAPESKESSWRATLRAYCSAQFAASMLGAAGTRLLPRIVDDVASGQSELQSIDIRMHPFARRKAFKRP